MAEARMKQCPMCNGEKWCPECQGQFNQDEDYVCDTCLNEWRCPKCDGLGLIDDTEPPADAH
jgi:hypothetical protein